MSNLLSDYKHFRVFEADLITTYGDDLINAKADKRETVYCTDVVTAIKKFRKGETTQDMLLDWVNTLWFCDGLFIYDESQCDSIASVMTELETLDEDGVAYTNDEFDRMVAALEQNIEYVR